MRVNLGQLRALLAVADEGGFGAAAEVLGISQSAVSHAMAALERSAGGPVMRRAAPAAVTSLGQRLLPHARTAVRAAEAVDDLLAEGTGGATGTVRLGAPQTVCVSLLPRLLERWSEEHPRVRVEIFEGEYDEIEDWLAAGTIDAGVLDSDRGDGVVIGEDTFCALVRSDHPLAGEETIHLSDLDDDPLLLSQADCESKVFRAAGVSRTPTHRIRDMASLIGMVRAGAGVTVVPEMVGEMLDPRVVLVRLAPAVTRRLLLTGPRNRPWHPAVDALVRTGSQPDLNLSAAE